MRKSFGPKGIAKLEALARGFVIRKIMKLKDVQNRVKLIKDHDVAGFGDDIENQKVFPNGCFNKSRMDACRTLCKLIEQLQKNGQWVILNREEMYRQMRGS